MIIEDITEQPLHGITLLYGPAGTGKSTACLEALKGRSIYVSTNKNFNVERLQTMREDAQALISQLVLFEPKDLLELEKAVQSAVALSNLASILIVDSLATYVRASDRKLGNLALNRMLETLKKAKCPVLLTSEVYDYVRGKELQYIGGDMLRLASNTILELNAGQLTLKKHPLYAGRVWAYTITDSGLEKV